ncbi:nuclear transport factor 2 family protein [Streptomyces sp. NPDC005791]|uniref:nuclear transport factor 2 family protein n=1 Tax=unclassified Streptomyces TaxID=2593676 RepID=UPI0033C88734
MAPPGRAITGSKALSDLADHAEITALTDRFLAGLDAPRAAGCDSAWARSLFTGDVRLDLPSGSHRGITGAARFCAGPKPLWARTHHIAMTCAVDLAGDRARAWTNVHAAHVAHDTGNDVSFAGGGRYEIDAVRTTDGWRIAALRVTVVWTAGRDDGTEP